jgi:hypothetical protein
VISSTLPGEVEAKRAFGLSPPPLNCKGSTTKPT